MSAEERLAIGSVQLDRACVLNSDPHEPGWQGRLEIARGREYLDYVTAHARPGELDQHIRTETLEACLRVEGWPRDVRALVLSVGSDQQVELIVQSVARPQSYCNRDLTRFSTPHDAERLYAACDRLGLREIAD